MVFFFHRVFISSQFLVIWTHINMINNMVHEISIYVHFKLVKNGAKNSLLTKFPIFSQKGQF